MKKVTVYQKKMRAADGTELGYQIIGKRTKDLVLCNGLGGAVLAWKFLYEKLASRYRFLSWDYRGLYRSGRPKNLDHLTIRDHVEDLECLLKKEKTKKVILVGWSMGVQIALEAYRHFPERIAGLILVNGTSGSPFKMALNSPLSQFVLPVVNELAKKVEPAVQPTLRPLAKRIINAEGFLKIVERLGLIHEKIDSRLFKQISHEMIATDLEVYHHIMDHLARHDASDVLPQIRIPTLIIASERDRMTPMSAAQKMVREIPDAQFFVVPEGSHYSLLEFPDLIVGRIEQFLKEHYS